MHPRPLRELALQAPGLDRFRAALQRHLVAAARSAKASLLEPAGHAADEDLAGRGRLLEPGRDIHGVAADGVVALLRAGRAADDLAGVHPDADLERAVQLAQRLPDLQGAAKRALRVVVMSRGAPKIAMTASPMYFSSVPPKSHDLGRHRREIGALQLAHGLGVAVLGASGESDEVREEDRHQAPLVRDRHAGHCALPCHIRSRVEGGHRYVGCTLGYLALALGRRDGDTSGHQILRRDPMRRTRALFLAALFALTVSVPVSAATTFGVKAIVKENFERAPSNEPCVEAANTLTCPGQGNAGRFGQLTSSAVYTDGSSSSPARSPSATARR